MSKAKSKKVKEEPRLVPKEPEGGLEEPRLENKAVDLPDAPEEDYLRKYQYRKQTPFGSVASDPQPGSKAAIMKEKLLQQDRVRIIIPRSANEDPKIKLSVNLNGYRLDLPKQVYLELPQQIAEVIMDSQHQTEEALQLHRISGDKKKEDALL